MSWRGGLVVQSLNIHQDIASGLQPWANGLALASYHTYLFYNTMIIPSCCHEAVNPFTVFSFITSPAPASLHSPDSAAGPRRAASGVQVGWHVPCFNKRISTPVILPCSTITILIRYLSDETKI